MRRKMKDRIALKIKNAIPDAYVEVIDESQLHAGHAGNTMTGESHFKLIIKSDYLSAKPKVLAHKEIFSILEDEMKLIHALSVQIVVKS
jgi:BolA protein